MTMLNLTTGMNPMTPQELKQARHAVGLTAQGFARMLRMGEHAGRTVRRWESGETEIPGYVELVCELLDIREVRRRLGIEGAR